MTVVAPVRTRRGWDIALSVILLVLNFCAFVIGGMFQFFALAFTDYCPPATCDIAAGTDAVFTVTFVIAGVGVLATVATIVLLVLRFRAWWVPLVALIATIVGWCVSFTLYFDAVS